MMMMMCNASAKSYNMLARKFYMCTVDVKIALFRAYCTYSKAKMKKLQVAINDALRILLKYSVQSNCLYLVMFLLCMPF